MHPNKLARDRPWAPKAWGRPGRVASWHNGAILCPPTPIRTEGNDHEDRSEVHFRAPVDPDRDSPGPNRGLRIETGRGRTRRRVEFRFSRDRRTPVPRTEAAHHLPQPRRPGRGGRLSRVARTARRGLPADPRKAPARNDFGLQPALHLDGYPARTSRGARTHPTPGTSTKPMSGVAEPWTTRVRYFASWRPSRACSPATFNPSER